MEHVGLDFVIFVVWLGLLVTAAVVVVEFGPMVKARYIMSRHSHQADDQADDQADEKAAVSAAKRNNETGETMQQDAETRAETLSLAEIERIEAETLARLVLADKIGITDAVKIGMVGGSGGKYQRKTRLLRAAIERQKVRYPPLSEAQRATRQEMQLPLRD